MERLSAYIGDLYHRGKNGIHYQKDLWSNSFDYESFGAAVILVIGVVLKIFKKKLYIPLVCNSLAFFAGKGVIYIGSKYNIYFVNKGTEELRSIVSKTPSIRRFSFLFSLLIYNRAPKLSGASAALAGWLASAIFRNIQPPDDGKKTVMTVTLF